MNLKSYAPDISAMGDCAHCGHVYESHKTTDLICPVIPEETPCAECDCENGGADCNLIKTPETGI